MAVARARKAKLVRVGHTPDMDDAFMFYGLACGAVATSDLRFEHVIEDIQRLNERASQGDLEMTAVSAARYPYVAKQYAIVSVGSSVGRGYGPLVISKRPTGLEELTGKRIAVPGIYTTAYLLLRLAVPAFEHVEMSFSDIPDAVLRGEVDAGLVIHEWQLTYRDSGLLPVLDLGVWWQQHVKLPLPLGLNVIKRSLSKHEQVRIATLFRDSILHAFAHQEDALAYAMKFGRGTDATRSRQFIGMYVNEETLTLSKPCREALSTLYDKAFKAGLIPSVPQLSVVAPAKA